MDSTRKLVVTWQIILLYGPYSMQGEFPWPALTSTVTGQWRKPLAPGEALLTPSDTVLPYKPAEKLQILLLSWLSGGCVDVFRHSWCFVCIGLFLVTQLVYSPGGVVWLSEVTGSLPSDFHSCFGKLQAEWPLFLFFPLHSIKIIRAQTSVAVSCFLSPPHHLFLCYIYFSPPHLRLFACSAITRFACDHIVHTHLIICTQTLHSSVWNLWECFFRGRGV